MRPPLLPSTLARCPLPVLPLPSLDGSLACTPPPPPRAAVRPYLLRRQKSDVLRGDDSLAPLEETIVWVEMTLLQKKMYRAVLEARRDVLVAGVDRAPLPSLLNMQMEVRPSPFVARHHTHPDH